MLKAKGIKSVTYVGYTNDLKKEFTFIIQAKELNLPGVENGNLFIRKKRNQKQRQFLGNII